MAKMYGKLPEPIYTRHLIGSDPGYDPDCGLCSVKEKYTKLRGRITAVKYHIAAGSEPRSELLASNPHQQIISDDWTGLAAQQLEN